VTRCMLQWSVNDSHRSGGLLLVPLTPLQPEAETTAERCRGRRSNARARVHGSGCGDV
jgi:hypothetical protein